MQSKPRHPPPPPPPLRRDDHFDRLPDPLLIIILNNVADVRSLALCSAISTRFRSLVPLVHYLSIHLTAADIPSPKPQTNILCRLRCLLRRRSPRPPLPRLLCRFTDLRTLHIQLPAADVRAPAGVFIAWHAEFGSTLRSCTVLAGVRSGRPPPADKAGVSMLPESFTNALLKDRVMWTVSALIAAATRHHHFVLPVVREHAKVESVVVTDAEGQGTLRIAGEQVRELREGNGVVEEKAGRTQVPATSVELRYAAYLEGMQGATLVEVRTDGGGRRRRDTEEVFGGAAAAAAAARALMKRKSYVYEMNGF